MLAGSAMSDKDASQLVANHTGKPWKLINKHANKNKKEKLRRVYSELDQHWWSTRNWISIENLLRTGSALVAYWELDGLLYSELDQHWWSTSHGTGSALVVYFTRNWISIDGLLRTGWTSTSCPTEEDRTWKVGWYCRNLSVARFNRVITSLDLVQLHFAYVCYYCRQLVALFCNFLIFLATCETAGNSALFEEWNKTA